MRGVVEPLIDAQRGVVGELRRGEHRLPVRPVERRGRRVGRVLRLPEGADRRQPLDVDAAQAEIGLLREQLDLARPRVGVARLALQRAELQRLAAVGPNALREGPNRGADQRHGQTTGEETRHGRNAPRKKAGRSWCRRVMNCPKRAVVHAEHRLDHRPDRERKDAQRHQVDDERLGRDRAHRRP